MQQNSTRQKVYDPYFDFLRGIAIIAVVGIHAFIVPENYDGLLNLVGITCRQLLHFAVPLFLVISGYFLSRHDISNKNDYVRFLRQHIPQVYVPMIIWSIPWIILDLRGSGGLLYNMVMWVTGGISIFYFITLIIECYICLPLLNKVNRGGVIALAMISIMFTTLTTYIRMVEGKSLPMIIYGSLPAYAIYYALGCYLSKQTTIRHSIPFLLLLCVLCIAEQVAETLFISNTTNNPAAGLKPLTMLFCITIIMIFFDDTIREKFKRNRLTETIRLIGVHSFTIYLTHLIVLFVITWILPFKIWVVNWILCLSIDYLFIILMQRTINDKYHWYLGIR